MFTHISSHGSATSLLRHLSYRLTLGFALVAVLWAPIGAQAQTPLPKGRITDQAVVLSVQDYRRLAQLLATYERETSHQIAVLTVPSLSGESIEAFSLRVAKSWGMGRKGVNNGILVVLAPQERKVRIQLGLGFERYITNARAEEIIRTQMLPPFRQRKYAEGLEHGLTELMAEGRNFVVSK